MLKENKTLKEVERLLQAIKSEKQALQDISEQYIQEVEQVKQKYQRHIEQMKENIRNYELQLEKLCRKHKYELFDRSDIVETAVGRVILTIKEAVKRAKGVLEKLEELGWTEAIIIEKKVKWDELEKWPDEKLIAIGTERVRKEKIEYELK